jgi:glycosyltransferase involved in cell wall biosynthesis
VSPDLDHRLVSVVIPCYQQSDLLSEAITSVTAQSHPRIETIVIDDGSDDMRARAIALGLGAKYIRQDNRGLSSARNRGLAESTGDFIVFLDADDRLLPDALAIGVRELAARPACSFVSGDHRYIDRAGRVVRTWQRPPIELDHYAELLSKNFIGPIAPVMFRRQAVVDAGGFDPSLRACEDYDLYLRLARRSPVFAHNRLVAEYRKYAGSMSDDPLLMLTSAIRVLRRQGRGIRGDARLRAAYRRGVRFWQGYYGPDARRVACGHLRTPGCRLRGLKEIAVVAGHAPALLWPRDSIGVEGRGRLQGSRR